MKGSGMLAQVPGGCLRSCQPCTVNARLLARTDAYRLPIIGEADRVGLGILERDHRQNQVACGLWCQLFLPRWNVLQQFCIWNERIALLLERDTKNVSPLNLLRLIG